MSFQPKAFLDQKRKLYLLPGQIAIAEKETLISTLLGSCVAVCLHCPLTKIGGMNHYLLPEVIAGEKGSPRYGVVAIQQLIEHMEKQGADRYQLQAKIFGGAAVLADNRIGFSIGQRNIEMAERSMKEAGIWVVRKDVGGERGRRITFDTTTFEVMVQYNLSDEKKTA